jgi:hypothetical protein
VAEGVTRDELAAGLRRPRVVAGPGAAPPPGEPVPPTNEPPRAARGGLWDGCPVTPLGVSGDLYLYLDVLNQLRAVKKHDRETIRSLFGGRIEVLQEQWPRWSKDGETIIGWDQDRGASALVRACTEAGIWDEAERVRGVGAWPDGTGDLIWHCGDRILCRGPRGGDDWIAPGLIGRHVYPAKAVAPRPADCSEEEGRQAARDLVAALGTWRWVQGDLDAHLLLGWVLAAMAGGALSWRPMAWVTGDKATGKSTLTDLIHAVMGGAGGIITATDVTEAGVRQRLMESTVPVWLDEAEAEDDNRRLQAVVKLARQASSGGMVLRGGAEHRGAEFKVRSAFIFSSILIPPLPDQDLSRLAVLQLRPLERGTTAPKVNGKYWGEIGKKLRRAIWDGWPMLHERLELYRAALTGAGHSARACDQYGTLLALADLVLTGGEPDAVTIDTWASALPARQVDEDKDQRADWERCVSHLLGQPIDVHRQGARHTVGEWIVRAAELPGWVQLGALGDVADARRHLRRWGIGIVKKGREAVLEVANRHPALEDLYRDTRWRDGVHRQSLGRVPGALAPSGSRTMAGVATRVIALPVAALGWLLEDGGEAPADGAGLSDLR